MTSDSEEQRLLAIVKSGLERAGYKVNRTEHLPLHFMSPEVMRGAVDVAQGGSVVHFFEAHGPSELQSAMLNRCLEKVDNSLLDTHENSTPPRLMLEVLRELGVEFTGGHGDYFSIYVNADDRYVCVHVGGSVTESVTYGGHAPSKISSSSSTSMGRLTSIFMLDESGVKVFLPDRSQPNIDSGEQPFARHANWTDMDRSWGNTEGTWDDQTVLTEGSTPSAGTTPSSITSGFGKDIEIPGHPTNAPNSLTDRVAAQQVAISELCADFRKTNDPENELQLELFIRLLEAVLARLRQIENGIGATHIEPALIEPLKHEAIRLTKIDNVLDAGERIVGQAERGVSLWNRAQRLAQFFSDLRTSLSGSGEPIDPSSMGA